MSRKLSSCLIWDQLPVGAHDVNCPQNCCLVAKVEKTAEEDPLLKKVITDKTARTRRGFPYCYARVFEVTLQMKAEQPQAWKHTMQT